MGPAMGRIGVNSAAGEPERSLEDAPVSGGAIWADALAGRGGRPTYRRRRPGGRSPSDPTGRRRWARTFRSAWVGSIPVEHSLRQMVSLLAWNTGAAHDLGEWVADDLGGRGGCDLGGGRPGISVGRGDCDLGGRRRLPPQDAE